MCRAIFTALNQHEAEALLAKTVQKYAKTAPRLSTWLETAIPQGLTVSDFLAVHRRLLRTTNSVERLNKEIRRRTRVVSIFPNEASCLRLGDADEQAKPSWLSAKGQSRITVRQFMPMEPH